MPLSLFVVSNLSEWPPARRTRAVLVADRPETGWAGQVFLPPHSPFRRAHGANCSCCSREGVSMVLAQLFQERVLGSRANFEEVVLLVDEEERPDVITMLEQDVLTRARYSLQT